MRTLKKEFNKEKNGARIKIYIKKIKINKENLDRKIKCRKSYKYNLALVIIFVGFSFFLSSNKIFNYEGVIKSTPFNEVVAMKNNKAMITNAVFNSKNRLLQISVKIDKSNITFDKDISVEARERKNPLEKLGAEIKKISNSEYVILITLPKEWSVVELRLIEDTEEKSYANLYVDKREIEEDEKLKEKNDKEYLVEITENEIELLLKNIDTNNKNIEEKQKNIRAYEKEISNLEDEKKYLTDKEVVEINTKIEQLYNKISDAKSEIDKIKVEEKEIKSKIEKLESKKNDIKNGV